MKKKLDIAIIIALDEEFKTIFSDIQPNLSIEITPDYGSWYEWHFNDLKGEDHKIVIRFTGEIGPAHAIQFTTMFLEHYNPKILINLGFAGSLDKDVKLGDLVISTLADLYDDAGKIEEVDGIPYLVPSGRPTPIPDFKDAVENFQYLHMKNFKQCIDLFNSNREKLIKSFEDKIPTSLLGNQTTIHTGRTASGSDVVASPAWKNTIKRKDRKYLSIDMESAAVAFSARPKGIGDNPKILIIRCISDPADDRKKEIDSVGGFDGGAIRKWAMLNAIAFLRHFLPTLGVNAVKEKSRSMMSRVSIGQQNSEALLSEVTNLYMQKGSIALEAYSHFLQFFNSEPIGIPIHDYIIHRVEKNSQDQMIASVSGFPGTGKSALLSCVCLRQIERYSKGESNFFPIYINMHEYLIDAIKAGMTEESVANHFRNEVKDVFRKPEVKKSKAIMLIVDGCDEYYRHPAQSLLDQELRTLLPKLAHDGKIVRIFGVGRNERLFAKGEEARTLRWAQLTELISLERVLTSSSKIPEIIDAYIQIADNRNTVNLKFKLQEMIRKYAIKEIDYFTLFLLEKAIVLKWDHVIASPGIGSLYFEFCCKGIRDMYGDTYLSDSDCGRLLIKIAKQVFATYVEDEADIYSNSGDQYMSLLLTALPHLHASIKEFLIAEHIIECLVSGILDEDRLLKYIYPYGINRFVKSILNRNKKTQNLVFKTIDNLFKHLDIEQQTHLCYLLGRFDDPELKQAAIKMLKEVLSRSLLDKRKDNPYEDTSFRQWLLLVRTIHISLIYLEDKSATSEYLNHILSLNAPEYDDLNRGFHLEYYEDMPRSSKTMALIQFDNLDVAPRKTFEILHAKLLTDLIWKRTRRMTEIELHTLCSICVNRHIIGKLANHKREKIYVLLDQVLRSSSLLFSQQLQTYIEMAHDLLGRESVSVGTIISEFYNLKKNKRAGWNASVEIDGKLVRRKCPRPESIAEHTYGCILIADILLPNTHNDPEYSKAKIKDMLQIHDLGEAYEGDIVKKNEVDIQKEDDRMRRIAYLASINPMQGMKDWGALWDDFANAKTINGQIARDIDHIENFVSLKFCMQYKCQGVKCEIPDSLNWAKDLLSAKKVKTDIGKQVLKKLSHKGNSPFESFYNR